MPSLLARSGTPVSAQRGGPAAQLSHPPFAREALCHRGYKFLGHKLRLPGRESSSVLLPTKQLYAEGQSGDLSSGHHHRESSRAHCPCRQRASLSCSDLPQLHARKKVALSEFRLRLRSRIGRSWSFYK